MQDIHVLILLVLDSMFNLELLQKYGANAWRVHNYQLESQLKMLQKETEEYREKIREISRERKNEQVSNALMICPGWMAVSYTRDFE